MLRISRSNALFQLYTGRLIMTTTAIATSADQANRFTIFSSREEYQAFVATFKSLAARRELTPEVLALRALVLGKPLGRAFSPVTNETKLANGHARWAGAMSALSLLRYSRGRTSLLELAAHLPEAVYKSLVDEASRVRDAQLEAEYAKRSAQ
jgi:hypothetical protein